MAGLTQCQHHLGAPPHIIMGRGPTTNFSCDAALLGRTAPTCAPGRGLALAYCIYHKCHLNVTVPVDSKANKQEQNGGAAFIQSLF